MLSISTRIQQIGQPQLLLLSVDIWAGEVVAPSARSNVSGFTGNIAASENEVAMGRYLSLVHVSKMTCTPSASCWLFSSSTFHVSASVFLPDIIIPAPGL